MVALSFRRIAKSKYLCYIERDSDIDIQDNSGEGGIHEIKTSTEEAGGVEKISVGGSSSRV